MSAIRIMNEDEIQRTESAWGEAGFGCVQTPLGNLPVKAMDISTRITGLVSETVVRQTYVNRYEQPLEATYIFPLPDRGAVGDFKMIVGGRVIDGVLKERGQARREYQQAIDQGHRASIVEEERPDTFTMRVGNIDVGEEVTIEFKVTSPLIFADGEATFRFPLVVAPRYIPGRPLDGGNVGDGAATDTDAVPDASRISPPVLLKGFPNPIALSIEAEIDGSALPLESLQSSLHAVTVDQEPGEAGNVHVEIQPGERVNRDFILRFQVAEDAVKTGFTYTREDDGGGTFMATLVPPAATQGAQAPRDIVFVLDRSGSMSGWKMVAARRALGRMLDTLTPEDRFQVIVFDNVTTKFGHSLVEGTNRNRYRAIEDLSKVEARGGTEMAQPIYEGLDMLSGGYEDRRRMLVLVTDGQVGNEQQIVAGVQQRMKNVRIFTVGIDQAVNAGFLNRLADVGGGRCELVESEQRLDDAMDRIHRTIDTPVLTDLTASLQGVDLESGSIAPEREPDLFAGAPVIIFGRYRGSGTPKLRLSGAQRDGSSWSTTVDGAATSSNAVTAIWARQRVRTLEDKYAARGRDDFLSEEITALSLKFGVLCRFTSWVAVDREAKVETDGDLRQVVQPVEQVDGWGAQPGYGQGQYSQSGIAPPPPSGAGWAAAPQSGSFGGGGFNNGSSGWAAQAPQAARRSAPGPSGFAPSQSAYGEQESFDDGADMDLRSLDSISASQAAHQPTKSRVSLNEGQSAGPPQPGAAGSIQSSPLNLSPEYAKGQQDHRSDVFMIGALAFGMLQGQLPITGATGLERVANAATWNEDQLNPVLSGKWLEILRKAMAADPADRHVNARELFEHLETAFGRDAMLKKPTWKNNLRVGGDGTMPLIDMVQRDLFEDDAVIVVVSWLAAAVAQIQEETGRPVGELEPHRVNVEVATGAVRINDRNGGFLGKLKRWLGLESGPAGRDDFWK